MDNAFFSQNNTLIIIVGFISALVTIVLGIIEAVRITRKLSERRKGRKCHLKCSEISTTYFEVLNQNNGKIVTKPIKLKDVTTIKSGDKTTHTKTSINPDETDIIVRSRIRITNDGKTNIGDNKSHKLKLLAPAGFTFSAHPKIENSTNNIPVHANLSHNNAIVEIDWTLLEKGYGFDVVTDSIIPAGYFTQNILESFYNALTLAINFGELKIEKEYSAKAYAGMSRDIINYLMSFLVLIITGLTAIINLFCIEYIESQFNYNIVIPEEDTINAELFTIEPDLEIPLLHNYKIISKEKDSVFTNTEYYNVFLSFDYKKQTYNFYNDTILISIPESDFEKSIKVDGLALIKENKEKYHSFKKEYYYYNTLAALLLLYMLVKMIIITIKDKKNNPKHQING